MTTFTSAERVRTYREDITERERACIEALERAAFAWSDLSITEIRRFLALYDAMREHELTGVIERVRKVVSDGSDKPHEASS